MLTRSSTAGKTQYTRIQTHTLPQAIAQFCLLAVVGMLLGIAFGAATSWLLDNIFRDPTLTTIVTLLRWACGLRVFFCACVRCVCTVCALCVHCEAGEGPLGNSIV